MCDFQNMDVRSYEGDPVDLVLCNPPYFPLGSGSVSPDPLKAAARHECAGGLSDLVRAGARFAPRVCLSVPRVRQGEAEDALASADRPVVRRLILREGIVLLEGSRDARLCRTEEGSLRQGSGHGPLAARLFGRAGARLKMEEALVS